MLEILQGVSYFTSAIGILVAIWSITQTRKKNLDEFIIRQNELKSNIDSAKIHIKTKESRND